MATAGLTKLQTTTASTQKVVPKGVKNLNRVFSKGEDSPLNGVTKEDFNAFSGNLFAYLDTIIGFLSKQEIDRVRSTKLDNNKQLEEKARADKNKKGGKFSGIRASLKTAAITAALFGSIASMAGKMREGDDNYNPNANETPEDDTNWIDDIDNYINEKLDKFQSDTRRAFDSVLDFFGLKTPRLGEAPPPSTPSNTLQDDSAESFGESQMGGQFTPASRVAPPPPASPATAPAPTGSATRANAQNTLNQPALSTLAPTPQPAPVRDDGAAPQSGSVRDNFAAAVSRGEGTTEGQAKNQKYGKGGQYDITFGYGKYDGGEHKPVSQMTFRELFKFQKDMLANENNKEKTSAAGKYQFTKGTLGDLLPLAKLTLEDKFSPENQEKLFTILANRRGLSELESGKLTPEQATKKLALTWSSLDKSSVAADALASLTPASNKSRQSGVQVASANQTTVNNNTQSRRSGGGTPPMNASPTETSFVAANNLHVNG